MPHIHTEPGQHDHTVSAYIIRTDFDEPKLALHLHKKLGTFIQFGGHIELDETPWQAISHEIAEESGYEMSQLQLLQPRDRLKALSGAQLHPVAACHNTHDFDETHRHTDSSYAFVATGEPRLQVGEHESNEIILLTRQELMDFPANQTFESVREIGAFIFETCLPNWEKVDPATFA